MLLNLSALPISAKDAALSPYFDIFYWKAYIVADLLLYLVSMYFLLVSYVKEKHHCHLQNLYGQKFKVPKPLKLSCNSREFDQSFRRVYLPQVLLEAGRFCGHWDIQKACGTFSAQHPDPRLLSAVALQEREIMAGQPHAGPFVISSPWNGAISLSSVWCCGLTSITSNASPWRRSWITHPGALTFWNCEICCPGFEKILRSFTWFMSKT